MSAVAPGAPETTEAVENTGATGPGTTATGAGTTATGPRFGPVTLPRALLALVMLAGGWLALQAIHELQAIVGPLLLVVNLMILAYPVQAWLTHRKVPRVVGAIASALINPKKTAALATAPTPEAIRDILHQ